FPVSLSLSPASHRPLHSFPTRRSSDLARRRAPPSSPLRPEGTAASGPAGFRDRARSRCRPRRGGSRETVRVSHRSDRAASAPPRSEEHTSELQSRENLVCRLLLEKKKA